MQILTKNISEFINNSANLKSSPVPPSLLVIQGEMWYQDLKPYSLVLKITEQLGVSVFKAEEAWFVEDRLDNSADILVDPFSPTVITGITKLADAKEISTFFDALKPFPQSQRVFTVRILVGRAQLINIQPAYSASEVASVKRLAKALAHGHQYRISGLPTPQDDIYIPLNKKYYLGVRQQEDVNYARIIEKGGDATDYNFTFNSFDEAYAWGHGIVKSKGG